MEKTVTKELIKFLSVEKSTVDKTLKYIFELEDGLIMESTFIDNGSNKDIICVSCQTNCAMKCKFCHLTDLVGKIKLRNITSEEILAGVKYVNEDLKLEENNRPLLISYMGAGEPILNVDNCIESMVMIKDHFPHSRFGMATMMPKNNVVDLFRMMDLVRKNKIELKLHLSLHFTDETLRNEWMPNALDIKSSINALEFYQLLTKNPVELHYTLIEGSNDSDENINDLMDLVRDKNINVKFLHYKKREAAGSEACTYSKAKELVQVLNNNGLEAEFYDPPGADIGSSCGQFLLKRYAKK